MCAFYLLNTFETINVYCTQKGSPIVKCHICQSDAIVWSRIFHILGSVKQQVDYMGDSVDTRNVHKPWNSFCFKLRKKSSTIGKLAEPFQISYSPANTKLGTFWLFWVWVEIKSKGMTKSSNGVNHRANVMYIPPLTILPGCLPITFPAPFHPSLFLSGNVTAHIWTCHHQGNSSSLILSYF